jgi:ribosomal protein S18 acetylase RimI-like enzyme
LVDIIVRRAQADDAAAVESLNADVQAIHAQALPWRFKAPSPDAFSPEHAASLISNSDNLIFIAIMASEPVGYAYAEFIHRPDTPLYQAFSMIHLHHISVRPQARRQGAGHALMAAVRAAASRDGIDLITLDVYMFNKESREFFRREGFSPYVDRMWNR